MSDPATDVDRLLDLADLACEETASDDEFAELDAYLLGNPMFRRRYLNYCRIHIGLGLQLRAHRATEKVRQQIGTELAMALSRGGDGMNVVPRALPAPSFTSPVLHSASSYLSSGWPLAYLIATVIFGIGVLIGAFTYVSRYEEFADNTPPKAAGHRPGTQPQAEIVGRVTGMADCKWERNSIPPLGNDAVSLGREFRLESGLVEIGYNTGAKVILQGPVAYTVESKNGGFMSIGKLTGKVEVEKARGFAVRTPTATVTDLGTEFGVEVSKEGVTDTQVFVGTVRVERAEANTDARCPAETLTAGQSARVTKNQTTVLVAGKRNLRKTQRGSSGRCPQSRPPKTNMRSWCFR